LSPVERLEIYREQFWLRHTSSLVEDFPGVSGILGQTAWQRLIEGYLDIHPPTSFTLRDLGLRLPEYIASRHELEHQALCQDMARLERGYIEIFDAADALPITPEALAAVPEDSWQRARLVLHPALRLLQLDYPVAALRRALIEAKSSGQMPTLPEPKAHCLVLFRDLRRDLQMFHEQLSAGAHALLAALAASVPLVAACERAQAEVPEEAATIRDSVGPWFQSWAARGFIVAVEA
ncbi:MAG: DNA-binding domain-containing protein, partial [Polyangiaceae bacterium]